MKTRQRATICSVVLALLSPALSLGGEYYLYAPSPTTEEQPPSNPADGVLVRQITIERGDTLYGLSKKYGKIGMYYPQILIFNEIKNPDLIYAGKKLLVPITRKQKPAASSSAEPRVKKSRKVPANKARVESSTARPAVVTPRATKQVIESAPTPTEVEKRKTPESIVPVQQAPVKPAPVKPSTDESEQSLYRNGITAYKEGRCRQAVEAFDIFLARFPSSPLSPDVSLYKADCLLKLAAE